MLEKGKPSKVLINVEGLNVAPFLLTLQNCLNWDKTKHLINGVQNERFLEIDLEEGSNFPKDNTTGNKINLPVGMYIFSIFNSDTFEEIGKPIKKCFLKIV